MRNVIVRYKVKPGRLEEHVGLVRSVFEELREKRPEDTRYAAVQGQDGLSFIHIASLEVAEGSNPITALASFRAFQMDIAARCDELPSSTEVTVVGDYGLFERL